jgi:K+-sensing histidine kinase KdpD
MRRHVAQIALTRYGLAVLAVEATVAFARWLRPVALVAGRLWLVAILTVGWMCGLSPARVAWGLATLAFTYDFTPPLDSLAVDRVELPRLIIFALLGLPP